MPAADIHLLGNSLALHPPVMIATICLFMYIRSKAIASSNPTEKVNPIFPFRNV